MEPAETAYWSMGERCATPLLDCAGRHADEDRMMRAEQKRECFKVPPDNKEWCNVEESIYLSAGGRAKLREDDRPPGTPVTPPKMF